MDRNRVCTNYWDPRPYSRPQVQIPRQDHTQNIKRTDSNPRDASRETCDNVLPDELNSVLKRLLKKADLADLQSLHDILTQRSTALDPSVVDQLLTEEILKRPQ